MNVVDIINQYKYINLSTRTQTLSPQTEPNFVYKSSTMNLQISSANDSPLPPFQSLNIMNSRVDLSHVNIRHDLIFLYNCIY